VTKSELRTYYLNKRDELTPEQVSSLSDSIESTVIEGLLNDISSIHLFLSIPDSQEIQTQGIITACWEKDIQTATSITKFSPKRLGHSWFDAQTHFTSGAFNVPVPSPIIPIDDLNFDVVLVPLLCVDTSGNRIGYGQGFYDSFLTQLPQSTKKIGLSLFDPLQEKINSDPWDIALDGVVTPKELILF
jgi:5-formyltetrahydrofolate cyclo-ligase